MRQTSQSQRQVWFWALGYLAITVGCGGDSIAPVSGTVTLDSKPLADAYVVFEPIEVSAEKVASGKTDTEGRYTLSMKDGRAGCLVGKHKVRLTTVAPDAMADERSPLPKDRVPMRYQDSPPVFEVAKEGSDQANFDLTRK